eukprot:Em0056g12a
MYGPFLHMFNPSDQLQRNHPDNIMALGICSSTSNHVLGIHFCSVPWDSKADRLKRICRTKCFILDKRRKNG